MAATTTTTETCPTCQSELGIGVMAAFAATDHLAGMTCPECPRPKVARAKRAKATVSIDGKVKPATDVRADLAAAGNQEALGEIRDEAAFLAAAGDPEAAKVVKAQLTQAKRAATVKAKVHADLAPMGPTPEEIAEGVAKFQAELDNPNVQAALAAVLEPTEAAPAVDPVMAAVTTEAAPAATIQEAPIVPATQKGAAAKLPPVTNRNRKVRAAAPAVRKTTRTGTLTPKGLAGMIDQMVEKAVKAKPAPTPVPVIDNGRRAYGVKAPLLPAGGLEKLVREYVRRHKAKELGATEVAKALGRSSGAVANALNKGVQQGIFVQTQQSPRRYRAA